MDHAVLLAGPVAHVFLHVGHVALSAHVADRAVHVVHAAGPADLAVALMDRVAGPVAHDLVALVVHHAVGLVARHAVGLVAGHVGLAVDPVALIAAPVVPVGRVALAKTLPACK